MDERAQYRRGELRLILSTPEPWTEYDRAKFLKAIEEATLRGPGQVSVSSAFISTWNPSDQKPNGVVDADQMDKLIIKFGSVDRLAEEYQRGLKDGSEKGWQAGREEALRHGSPATTHVENPEFMNYVSRPVQTVELPLFNLGPLSPEESAAPYGGAPMLDHECLQCGKPLSVCDSEGCGGAKPSGFRFGPRPAETPAEALATVADPSLLPPSVKELTEPPALSTDYGRGPYGAGVDTLGNYPATSLDFAESCERDDCLMIHEENLTPCIFDNEELDAEISKGNVCDDDDCFYFHYSRDGSSHQPAPERQ